MKTLTRIILVNWYLFQAEEWDISGNVMLAGKNGAGKSSFIDAIQYVLLGGNKTYWKPNAKSPDKSIRDVKGYVLGRIKLDESLDENSELRPRNDALSRIALVFTDVDTGVESTVGVALHANINESGETIEGFFVVEEYGLKLGDFLYLNDGQSYPRNYSDLKANIKQASRDSGVYFPSNSKAYLAQLTQTLSYPDRPVDVDKFKRSFTRSIALSSLKGSVSDFVKENILDAEPLDVAAMREGYQSFQKKSDEIVLIKKQLKQMAGIKKLFETARSHANRAASYKWCQSEIQFDALSTEIETLKEDMAKQITIFKDAYRLYRQSNAQLGDTRVKHAEISALINKDKNEANKKIKLGEKKTVENSIATAEKELRDSRGALSLATQCEKHADYLSDEINKIINQITTIISVGGNAWAADGAAIDTMVSSALTPLDNESTRLKQKTYELNRKQSTELTELETLVDRVKNIASGKADLSLNTKALIAVLGEKGIEATPVCQLVEVTDERWQLAIEAFLRGNTEALIVDPKDAHEAVSIYRSMKKELHGAIVVDTAKVSTWHNKIAPNTASTLIKGESELAVKYLQRLLSNIGLVEDTRDLMKSDRALTPDGMFKRQAGIQRLYMNDIPKLGKTISAQQIELLGKKEKELRNQLVNTEETFKKTESAHDDLRRFMERLEIMPPIAKQTAHINKLNDQLADIQRQIDAIDTSQTESLRQEQSTLHDQITRLEKNLLDSNSNRSSAKTLFKDKRANLLEKEKRIPELNADRKHATENSYYDASHAADTLERVYEKHSQEEMDSNYKAIKYCDDQLHDANIRYSSSLQKGQDGINGYNKEHGVEGIEINTMAELLINNYLERIDEYVSRLTDLGLHTKEKEQAEALENVKRSFRSDVSVKLKNQFNTMRRRIDELNNELNRRPFSSGLSYHFRYERKAEYQGFLQFIETLNEQNVADNNTLFDTDSGNEEVMSIIHRILDMDETDKPPINKKKTDDAVDDLLDYRHYYQYEIMVKDKENKTEEPLSLKMGFNSGGEQSTPFYVAMGASLASAYRIERDKAGNLSGGFGLYLADEAFQKMDNANTRQAGQYLNSIGLQLFVAAPDEAEPRLSEVSDMTLFFIREGSNIKVDTNIIRPAAKKLLFNAFEGIEATTNESEKTVEEPEPV